jgi:poly(3-hydroxybutyrate) depolymerase
MVAFVGRTSGQGRTGAFVTGLSAGGAMTAVMLATYPELFRGGAVIAGLPYGAAEGIPEAMRIMSRPGERDGADLADMVRRAGPATQTSPKLSIWHGDADRVVNAGNATDLARQWAVVAGLGTQPDSTTIIGPTTRSVWRDPAGEARIELNLVRGLGHGVPLATRRGGVGQIAPYMLEAGVSSSLEILRFWGLPTDVGIAQSRPEEAAADEARRAEAQTGAAQEVGGGVAGQVLGALKDKVPSEVEAVIAKALRAAGLMS